MKRLLSVFVVLMLVLSGRISAQEKLSSDIAPNTVITDIDGNVYQLYDILSSGKSVVIDFFATWCGPCWDYQQSGQLQSIWEDYGPNGSDEVMIFYVEADPGTPTSDLSQASGSSLGNYLINSPYPVVEDTELGNLFEISHYPSVFFICPDKRITEVGQLSPEEMATHLNSTCKVPDLENNLELLFFTNDLSPACQEQEVLPTVMVQNVGTNTIKEIGCQLLVNGTPWGEQTNWDVWLNTYETLELAFGPFLLDNSTEFTIQIVEVNSSEDTDPDRNVMTMVKEWPRTFNSNVSLVLLTDDYGLETSWELRDQYENLVAYGAEYPSNTTITENIQLINYGCYELKVFDAYGDGMCCNYTDGSYMLLDNEQNTLLAGGRFLKEDSGSFEYNGNIALATEKGDLENLSITVFPNPVSDNLSILFNDNGLEKNITVSDATGRSLFSNQFQGAQYSLDVSSFAAGVYFLTIADEKSMGRSSFVVTAGH